MTADAKDQHEPSMEEILASIRRIISEDGQPTPDAEVPQPPGNDDDVLELTDVADENEDRMSQTPPPGRDRQDDIDRMMAAPEPPAGGNGSATQQSASASPPDSGDGLVSAGTAAMATSAFAGLAAMADRAPARTNDIPLGAANRTLEEMTRELLRPMLKEWLDANLPQVVERLVKREVERMARRAETF